MDESNETGAVFSKGINLKELMSSHGAEFHLDVNFKDKKSKSDPFLDDDELFNAVSSDESDAEEVLKSIAESAGMDMLCSPEYASFSELAQKMTDCIPSGDVKILIVEEGEELVPYDAEVTIHYAAYWEKESISFDSTLTMNHGAPVKYQLGTGTLIPGLEIGLTTVKGPQARFHLLIQPAAAWGARGVPPRIRPEPALFTVSLVAVRHSHTADMFNDLPSEEQKKYKVTIKTVAASNARAKDLFQRRLYSKAARDYHKSLTVLQLSCPKTEEESNEIKRLICSVYVNLAVCYSKMEIPNKVLLMCDDLGRVTNIEKHCKGLFYYGKAFVMLGQYEEAEKYYKKALKLEPNNADIGKALADLDNIILRSAKKEKKMWQAAFKNKADDKEDIDDDIDEDFKENLKESFNDLVSREEYTKFDLPPGLLKKEVDYIKKFVKDFDKLVVLEDGEGSRKRLSIVKTMV
ncbi:inactive peptidyl-prolyl cis-trans isomerase shutdown-like [Plutella xylostella]|uniref:inactive peptidyl-prolyl cis-trans isomerase shutdown-like n=1 Tax=Plutella xylostella TaxID=51655 RepID=UPI002032B93B|nr:inactive peptidyl-prolyl cis-trans isomerase shutdown-like [Plutella xylostella]